MGGQNQTYIAKITYPNAVYEEETQGIAGDELNWQTKKTRHITLGNQTLAHIDVNPQGQTEKILVFSDHLGSSSLLTDSMGRVKTLYDYYPFGGTRLDSSDGFHVSAYQYTGKELDAETGLNYYGARYYAAGVGKFTQPDELSKSVPYDYLSNPQKLNEYSYVANNPMVMVDPDGRRGIKAALITAGIFIATHPLESALIAGFLYYAGKALYYEGKAAEALHDKDLAKASDYSEQALNAQLNAALIAAAWKDVKSKESKTATGKANPETAGDENSASKPKTTNTQPPEPTKIISGQQIKMQQGMSKVDLEAQLKGWDTAPVKSGTGTVYTDPNSGYNVRIMENKDGSYYARMQNKYGNYLDENGNYLDNASSQEINQSTHIILTNN